MRANAKLSLNQILCCFNSIFIKKKKKKALTVKGFVQNMLTPVSCNFQSPCCFKVFDLYLLLRSFSIKESPKPRLSCSCSGTCCEFRASPLQRTCNWALQEYFSLFKSLLPAQENWFESSFPAQQIVSGCFETCKQHGRDGCPCV